MWSEATLIVEVHILHFTKLVIVNLCMKRIPNMKYIACCQVVDVDENMHAPVFGEHAVLTGSVREDAARASEVLTAAASDADPPGRDSRLAYYIIAGSGMAHFSVDDAGKCHFVSGL